MSAECRNLALRDAPLVNRKSFFVLMKTSRRFRNRAYAEAQQHVRASFRVALKVAVQSAFALSSRHAIVRQCEVIHANFGVTGGLEFFARHFIKRSFFSGPGDVFVGIASLRGLNPGHEREAVERDAIGTQIDRLVYAL